MTARRKRRLAALVALAAVLTAVLAALAWREFGPLSAEERALVGVWEVRTDGVAPGTRRVVFELRPDRTYTCRHFDSATGGALPGGSPQPVPWRLRGAELRLDVPHVQSDRRRWDVFGPRHAVEVWELTPDGPAGYRYAPMLVNAQSSQKLRGGTLARRTPAGPE